MYRHTGSSSIIFLVLFGLIAPSYCFVCPTPTGYYANPEDCSSFYGCSNSVAYLYQCGDGTLYDATLLVCNWEDQVDCGTREDGDGGSEETTAAAATKPTTTEAAATTTIIEVEEPTTTIIDNAEPTTTTTAAEAKTTTIAATSSSLNPLPSGRAVAVYLSLTSDSVPGFTSQDDWTPSLYPYQQTAANVLILTFINPESMTVPLAFANMAKNKGSGEEGAVPKDTVLLFSIGGQSYSSSVNPWPWLTSREAAEAMAAEVSEWPELYPGCDGVDIDIETGAGDAEGAGANLVHFLARLKELRPDMVVLLPTYGYPQIQAEIEGINAGWDQSGKSSGLVDSIGIMVYEGTESLDWVDEYTESASFGSGWPITADVPERAVWVGIKGTETSATYSSLAAGSVSDGLGGIMVWYATVENGPKDMYDPSWDSSGSVAADSRRGMHEARRIMEEAYQA